MKIKNILVLATVAVSLLQSCRDEQINYYDSNNLKKGIFIANEGNIGQRNADISFIPNDSSTIENQIYSKANQGETLGDVMQYIAFKENDAYLVMNNSNKIIITDKYTMVKKGEITNTNQPRYIAFANNYIYVTENNWNTNERKIAIFDNRYNKVKTINLDRLSEKIVESGNYIYVQTDGITYENYSPAPTGHTITRVNPYTNEIDKTITLTDSGIIKDIAENNGFVYVLSSSDSTETTLYKINGKTSDMQKTILPEIENGNKISVDNGNVYILDSQKTVYQVKNNIATNIQILIYTDLML